MFDSILGGLEIEMRLYSAGARTSLRGGGGDGGLLGKEGKGLNKTRIFNRWYKNRYYKGGKMINYVQ